MQPAIDLTWSYSYVYQGSAPMREYPATARSRTHGGSIQYPQVYLPRFYVNYKQTIKDLLKWVQALSVESN